MRIKTLYPLSLLLPITLVIFSSCMVPPRRKIPEFRVVITNPLPVARLNLPIAIRVEDIKKVAPDFTFKAFLVSPLEGGRDLASQAEDTNGDGEPDTLVFLIDLEPEARREVAVRYEPKAPMRLTLGYEKKTFAGIFPELEGLAWESEKTVYLMRADFRTTILFAPKSKEGLVLRDYLGALLSNEETQVKLNWIRCGGFGIWDGKRVYKPFNPASSPEDSVRALTRVISDGPVRSSVQIVYDNWLIGGKGIRMSSTLSISAGRYYTLNTLKIAGGDGLKIAALIPKAGTVVRDKADGLLMAWDEEGRVGSAIIFPTEAFIQFLDLPPIVPKGETENVAVVLAPNVNGELSYYLIGREGLNSFEEFESAVKLIAKSIGYPPEVKITPKPQRRKRGR
ncbi:TPA: DUF4861 domain-containing protein [Candidatus Poribacteria bacterium]|nr:DUF4861 domain-containing protein [Candidatus Poribacteria bacterium]